MPTLVLEQLVGGTRVSDERTGEETGVVRYIAYREDGGTKVKSSPFTPQVLKSDPSYVQAIKDQPAPPGTSYDRYDAQQYGSSLYDLEVTIYYSKNGRYGGPTDPDGPEPGEITYTVSSATEIRSFTIPVQAEQEIIVPGADTPQTTTVLRGLSDETPISTLTINAQLATFDVGTLSLINSKVNQLHYIAGPSGGPRLYRFKGARSIRQEGAGFTARYEWEFDIGSPARLWDGDNAPRVFGKLGDPDSPPVPQIGPVTYNNSVGWWRPPYCKIGADEETFEYTPPFFTQPVTITRPAPVVFIDGLTDDFGGHLTLPGLT